MASGLSRSLCEISRAAIFGGNLVVHSLVLPTVVIKRLMVTNISMKYVGNVELLAICYGRYKGDGSGSMVRRWRNDEGARDFLYRGTLHEEEGLELHRGVSVFWERGDILCGSNATYIWLKDKISTPKKWRKKTINVTFRFYFLCPSFHNIMKYFMWY